MEWYEVLALTLFGIGIYHLTVGIIQIFFNRRRNRRNH